MLSPNSDTLKAFFTAPTSAKIPAAIPPISNPFNRPPTTLIAEEKFVLNASAKLFALAFSLSKTPVKDFSEFPIIACNIVPLSISDIASMYSSLLPLAAALPAFSRLSFNLPKSASLKVSFMYLFLLLANSSTVCLILANPDASNTSPLALALFLASTTASITLLILLAAAGAFLARLSIYLPAVCTLSKNFLKETPSKLFLMESPTLMLSLLMPLKASATAFIFIVLNPTEFSALSKLFTAWVAALVLAPKPLDSLFNCLSEEVA